MNRLVFTADPDLALTFTSSHMAEVGDPQLLVRDPGPDELPPYSSQGRQGTHFEAQGTGPDR